MKHLLAGASLLLLACAASPALANGPGGAHRGFTAHLDRIVHGFWGRQAGFAPPPGFFSPGRHLGWGRGHHWGWHKPHNPHWPHHPMSP